MRFPVFSVVVLLCWCLSALAMPILFNRGASFSLRTKKLPATASSQPTIPSITITDSEPDSLGSQVSKIYKSAKKHITPPRIAIWAMVYHNPESNFEPKYPDEYPNAKDINPEYVLSCWQENFAALYKVGRGKLLKDDPTIQVKGKDYYVYTGSPFKPKAGKSWRPPEPVETDEKTTEKYQFVANSVARYFNRAGNSKNKGLQSQSQPELQPQPRPQ